ncbi:hypothetical protein LTR08_005745 [Meristemomyces frigidus]|nr:hypothetical protein LTR08_005745 [Meristemomyces frigidus]
MYCLVRLVVSRQQKDWLGDASQDDLDAHREVQGPYSDDLHDLVLSCLSPQPDDRVKFQDPIQLIDVHIDETRANKAQGMCDQSALPAVPATLTLRHLPRDRYAPRMQFQFHCASWSAG